MKHFYYNPIAENALELAEKNKGFYANFVREYKPCSAHKFLWSGQALQKIITDVKEFQNSASSTFVKNKCCAIIIFYANIYKTLTYEK